MNKKFLQALILVASTFSLLLAQNSPRQASSNPALDSPKAEMLRCMVCKHIAVDWFQFRTKMKQEVVKLGDGIVFIQSPYSSLDTKVFRVHSRERSNTFKACISMDNSQAKDSLCNFCLKLREIVKSGALVDWGDREEGVLTVIVSTDSAIRVSIFNLLTEFPERFSLEEEYFFPSLTEFPVVDEEPVLLKNVKPRYPEDAHRA